MSKVSLTDTHCHIQEILGPAKGEAPVADKWHNAGITDPGQVVKAAREVGVDRLMCVGCTVEDSVLAVEFARTQASVWASIGIHPHEASRYINDLKALDRFAALAADPKVVAVGECGLDFYYAHSRPEDQEKILRFQLELAQKHQLPLVFHVRDAFEQFWPIFDEYPGVRGVIHSFSSNQHDLEQIIARKLYVGLNGIMTFTKDQTQLDAARAVPLENMLLETDAPFLTPTPYRGTICEPKHIRVVAEFLALLRGDSLESIAKATTANALTLFGLR
jgi:TatD DNase family protein